VAHYSRHRWQKSLRRQQQLPLKRSISACDPVLLDRVKSFTQLR
jgi:hypothetical protein